MSDYTLKFTDEAQANSVLYTKVPTAWSESSNMDEPPVATEWMDKPNYPNIDIIGTIYKPTGATETVEDMEVPVMEAIEGYHVNIRADGVCPELDAYSVTVNTPFRVWG